MRLREDILGPGRALFLVAIAATGCAAASGDPGLGAPAPVSQEDASLPLDAAAGGEDGTAPEGAAVAKDAGPGSSVDAGSGSSPVDSSASDASQPEASAAGVETGRLVGMTAAHNAVRARVSAQPPLPALEWSQSLADYAQEWATSLAGNSATCAQPVHRSQATLSSKNYGENWAARFGSGNGPVSTPQDAVDQWAGEVACWTYGTYMGTEKCDTSCTSSMGNDGCWHYTQLVWRKTLQVGCGVATCRTNGLTEDIWVCNYAPAGNQTGQAPY